MYILSPRFSLLFPFLFSLPPSFHKAERLAAAAKKLLELQGKQTVAKHVSHNPTVLLLVCGYLLSSQLKIIECGTNYLVLLQAHVQLRACLAHRYALARSIAYPTACLPTRVAAIQSCSSVCTCTLLFLKNEGMSQSTSLTHNFKKTYFIPLRLCET